MRFLADRPFTFWVRLIGGPMMGIAFNKALYFVSPPEVAAYYLTQVPAAQKALDMVVCVASSVLVIEIGLQLSRFLDRHLPWETEPAKRFFAQLSLTAGFATLLVLALSVIYDLVLQAAGMPEDMPNMDPVLEKQQHILLGVWLTLLMMAVYLGGVFFQRWKASLIEAAELRQVAAQAQLNALKAQVDPHFLFNNFSTLTALIEEDPKLAVEYLGRLSQVYRYVLLHRDRDRTTLGQELDFIRAFLFLSQIRFSDEALRVEIGIPPGQRSAGIAPLTLQLLVENALKHNVLSRKAPMHLRIGLDAEGWLEVRNLRQPLARPEPSSGLGLKNIAARYALLGAPAPQVIHTDTEFIVRVPLLAAEPAPATRLPS